MRTARFVCVAVLAAALAAASAHAQAPDACDNADGAWNGAQFVLATAPAAGARVRPGFTVSGCSATFDGSVTWKLVARDGTQLANGYARGGSAGAGRFEFKVDYVATELRLAQLEVEAPRGGEVELARTVLPLVLLPPPPPEAPVPGAVPSGSWRLRKMNGAPVPGDAEMSLEISGGRAGGMGACNQWGATWNASGGVVALGPVAATKKNCLGPAMNLERRYFAALAAAKKYALRGHEMELADEKGTPLLVFVSGAGPDSGVATGPTTYRCEGGRTFSVEFDPQQQRAILIIGGRALTLKQVAGASGASYSDGRTTLRTKGRQAYIEENGAVTVRDCSAEVRR